MNVLFEECGWDAPAYQKLTDDVMARTPIVSMHDWYGEFGSLSVFDALDEQHRNASRRCSTCSIISPATRCAEPLQGRALPAPTMLSHFRR